MITQQRPQAFRPDINGLRAWAVLPVILFHFNIPGFAGGFVGVDIFFVISGFLMTQIIISKLEQGDFSLPGFFLARARRIIPALLVLCATLLAIAWVVLPPAEYFTLATHVTLSLLFVSNIKFWREAGYFDVASHEKWLLHTWSLAVEWQFYLLLPLMLIALWRLRPGRGFATAFMGAVFLASLALAIGMTPVDHGASFYLLPTRAWEMLLGGLVFLLSHRLVLGEPGRQALRLFGLILIVASIALVSATTSWPGPWTLVPVIGAALVIAAARTGSPWTDAWLAQWLGTRSYSLYLWHWPISVTLVYIDAQRDVTAISLALVATFALGELSYRLVENPARRYFEKSRWGAGTAGLALACLAVALPAVYVRQQNGISGRLAPEIESVFEESNNRNPRMAECLVAGPVTVPNCTYGGPTLGAIVIGDSHAAAIVRAVEGALPDKRLHVLDWSMANCPTFLGVQKVPGEGSANCGQFVRSSLEKQATLPRDVPLIIMNRTSLYAYGYNDKGSENVRFPSIYFRQPISQPTPAFLKDFRGAIVDTACAFAKTRPVYLVRPIPELKLNVPQVMGRALLAGSVREVSISVDEYRARHALVLEAQDSARAQCGVHILDPLPILCSDGRCHGARDGRPLYYDDDHLSAHGGKLLEPMFAQVFADKPRAQVVRGE